MDKQFLSGVSPAQAAKELNRIAETVTCLECCKLYILPETAACGHTLCHGCWVGRPACALCAAPLARRTLKPNAVLAKHTQCVQSLVSSFEKLFGSKLEEFIDLPVPVSLLQKDSNNVKAWLADSHNQFSAPISTQSNSFAAEVNTCDVQVHTDSKKPVTPIKVVVAPPPPQDDWDKIETIPDTEDITKNKENLGPVHQELFSLDDEYSTDHPRRSSRKRELKNDLKRDKSVDKHSSRDDITSNMSIDTDKLSKAKQNWSNVKKMRKEFSKLHKKNKNKLNISIEMCKKQQNTNRKPPTPPVEVAESQQAVTIDDFTPTVNEKVLTLDKMIASGNLSQDDENLINDREKTQVIDRSSFKHDKQIVTQEKCVSINNCNEKAECIPFLKKSALQRQSVINETKGTNLPNSNNHTINCNEETPDSDDIQITIKIGSTLTNIFIKKKKNDEQVKLNTDQEVQTAQCAEKSVLCDISPNKVDVQNIEINIGEKHVIRTVTQEINENEEMSNNIVSLDKSVSTKTNTASIISTVTQEINENEANFNKKASLDKSVSTKKNTASVSSITQVMNEHEAKSNNKLISDKSVSTKKNTASVSSITQVINEHESKSNKKLSSDKSVSTKKNTASAETVPFEITASVEKELSKIMECNSDEYGVIQNENAVRSTVAVGKEANEKAIDLDEDIFASGSVKEGQVKLLKDSQPAPSEILMPTLKQTRTQTQRQADKRDRDTNDDVTPKKKKLKVATEINTESVVEIENNQNKYGGNQSCSMNYDSVMEQVFASIDADMDNVDKSQSIIKDQSKVQHEIPNTVIPEQSQKLKTQKTQKKVLGVSKLANTQNVVSKLQQKESENLFTQSIKETQMEQQQKHGPETQAHIENLLTPGMCLEMASTNAASQEDIRIEATPCQDNDSDMSVYEETPQKTSFTKKSSDKTPSNKVQGKNTKSPIKDQINADSIINVSDSENTKNITMCEAKTKEPIETPTMNKFYTDIKHNSTPVARKSLNFVSLQDEGTRSMSIISKNTQEREMIDKAFEPSQKSFIKPLPVFPVQKLCVAASCLTQAEVKVLEALCKMKKWDFVREYTKDLTHLVVGVDKEGKCQRTVKFMCAVASGKWIIKYDWVTECIKRGTKVPEWSYEALDWTGDPGPARARTAARRLFEGLTFFCKPPFTVLNEDVLTMMLESAGGTVVTDARQVRVTGDAVRLLLAEPEHTQENQFTYLALELNIVPVNYEWALNCLGSYALSSILELLLCPVSLLPAATQRWPTVIITQEDADSMSE